MFRCSFVLAKSYHRLPLIRMREMIILMLEDDHITKIGVEERKDEVK